MTEKPLDKRTWSDSELVSAVAMSRSWRGVMRELGLCATSTGSIQVVKRHVARLGLDTSHFSGQRRWSDAQLRRTVADSYSWPELFRGLGLLGSGDDRTRVKAHAARLGLDVRGLDGPDTDAVAGPVFRPDIKHLREAGTAIATMWFLLCGYNVSIPLEPAVYDLLVSTRDGIKRVQVKTTTYNKSGWAVSVGRRPYATDNRGPLVPYDPDLLDLFFILDGELTMYVIPSRVIAGRVGILLSNYSKYVVGSAAFLMNGPSSAA
jgi:hypothetical protein